MPRFLKIFLFAIGLWLLTGVYIVGGNERAVVRRFGRAVTNAEGHVLLKQNGLHFDWPWPFSRVDRVNLNEIRTLTIPVPSNNSEPDELLWGEIASPEPTFLTGDKNLLNVRLTVHYRLADSRLGEFLYSSYSVSDRLSCLAETIAAETIAQSGVDYVQVSGLAELGRELARKLQQQADRKHLGLLIEEVTLDEITPPVQVKADFLDVANARADREQMIQAALSTAEQRRQSAEAEAREIRDAAQSQAQEVLLAAQGSAARFLQIIAQFQNPDSTATASRALARRLALEQYYHQTVTDILGKIQGKVFLDSGQPVDLTIWRSREAKSSPSPTPPIQPM
jgi:membrane protease subunit HflK